jgi:hypothetical protein
MKKILIYLVTIAFLILLMKCGGGSSSESAAEEASESAAEEASETAEEASDGIDIPDFPWPPPRPSAFVEIPKKFFSTCEYLYDVEYLLTDALDLCGYSERSYFSVPNGFAIVTRMEQINLDASSKMPPERWSVDPEVYSEFNLVSYLKAVFFANPGFFRVFTIIISDQPFHVSEESITEDEALDLLNDGLNTLPNELGSILRSDQTYCTVLIYEFEKPEDQDTSYVILPGRHIGYTHITKSAILNQIEKIHESRNGPS